MHKEQNVIKSLLIVVIICLSNNLYCQKKIIGNYSSLKAYQEHYKYYKFNENGIFEYHSGASLGDDEYGKGHYQIKNDSLILNYDLTELKLKSYHKIKEYYNTKNIVTIKVIVKDFKGNINTNTNVYIQKDKIGYTIREKGFVNINLKKEKKDYFLGVSNLGYDSYKLKLSKLKNYEIEIFLKKASTVSKAIKNDIKKFKIVEYKDDYMKLENNKEVIKLIKQTE
ncbi:MULTISPECIES: hypothetical protein [Polaribacter]